MIILHEAKMQYKTNNNDNNLFYLLVITEQYILNEKCAINLSWHAFGKYGHL